MATVWLIGMMGAGKTAVGRRLADRLDLEFVDTDHEVESVAGAGIAELWDSRGEGTFRDMEEAQVQRLAGTRAVVATGGGVVLRPASVESMRKSGIVIWLSASIDELVERVGLGGGRPLLEGHITRERLSSLLEERRPLYEAAADHTVETEHRSVDEVVNKVEQCIAS